MIDETFLTTEEVLDTFKSTFERKWLIKAGKIPASAGRQWRPVATSTPGSTASVCEEARAQLPPRPAVPPGDRLHPAARARSRRRGQHS
jgi:hypothetical protein